MKHESTYFNLRDAIRQILEPLPANAPSGELLLSISISEYIPPCIWGDREQLRQALPDLINTALRRAKTNKLSLECELVAQQADTLDLCFTIKDSTGIEASPFHHKQYLTFQQQQNKLPAPRILVVEDNEINLKLAEHILRKGGYLVDWAPNGETALEQVEQERYSLILMDIHMPELDGFQTTKLIRQREPGKDIPIIALTADTIQGYRERCIEAGMDSYLPKPYSKEELLTEVKRLLSARTPSQESAPSEPPLTPQGDTTENRWLDIEAILAKTQGNYALFSKMATIFIQRTPELLRDMQTSVEAQKFRELSELAHALKGMLGNFTEAGPFQTANQIEILAKEGAYTTLCSHFQQLQQEIAELREVFQQNL